MTEYEFKTAERPKVTRSKEPNLFTEAVASVNAAILSGKDTATVNVEVPMGEAKVRAVKKNGVETGESRTVYNDVEKVQRLLREAAPKDRTVRSVAELDKPKKGTATVSFWTVPLITRPRKDDAETAAS